MTDHSGQSPSQGDERLSWETNLGLLTNPLILRQLFMVVLLSGLLMGFLLSFLMAVSGEFEAIPMMLLISFLAAAGLGLLMLLVILIFFRNRVRVRFTLDGEGVLWETLDRRAKAGSRLATFSGLLGGSPGIAGAGMIGLSRETELIRWEEVDSVAYHPRSRTIRLLNSWRPIMLVACTAGNYENVAAIIDRRIRRVPETHGQPALVRKSPLPGFLLRTLFIVLAATPVFILPYPFELDIFFPLLMLLFALATLWLVPLFGWVVIGCAIVILAQIVLLGLEVKESMFAWRGTYRSFELLSGEDWLFLALAFAGLAYLVWFSVRAIRGMVVSALMEK